MAGQETNFQARLLVGGWGGGAWQCTGQNLLSQGKKNVNQIENEQHSMFFVVAVLVLYKNGF